MFPPCFLISSFNLNRLYSDHTVFRSKNLNLFVDDNDYPIFIKTFCIRSLGVLYSANSSQSLSESFFVWLILILSLVTISFSHRCHQSNPNCDYTGSCIKDIMMAVFSKDYRLFRLTVVKRNLWYIHQKITFLSN